MASLFKWVLYVYLLASVVAAFSAWGNSGIGVAASILGASMLSWWGASGIRGSLTAGNTSQKIAGLIFGIAFFIGAHWIATSSGFIVGLFGTQIGGGVWWVIGAVIGYLSTAKADAVPST
jgi:hypothetical protein